MNQTHFPETLQNLLAESLRAAITAAGYSYPGAAVVRSSMPGVQFQCNDAFAIAKQCHAAPLQVAARIADQLRHGDTFESVVAVNPGFINMVLRDTYLARYSEACFAHHPIPTTEHPATIVIDYGGANVAKPLHVGHVRSAVIGESLKRIARALGHTVIADVHLGDWGLQMGMVIEEVRLQNPTLPYFSSTPQATYPTESPVTMEDLDTLYPKASQRAKEDPLVMQAARLATVELQRGHPGYRALWRHFVDVSVAELKKDYDALEVYFDLWYGESDAHDTVQTLCERLMADHLAQYSDGALIMPVARDGDSKEMPPLLLRNSDGAELYAATDLATIAMRVVEYHPDEIVYVVDKRQHLHLEQVFRAAAVAGLVDERTKLEHVAFGTMNGPDNKPFKTRAGGTMKLRDLIVATEQQARARLEENAAEKGYRDQEKGEIVRTVSLAALKFGDLSNYHEKNYVFDMQRFLSFEGYTGPYILYSAVRARSILAKAGEAGVQAGVLQAPQTQAERDLHLRLAELPGVVTEAWKKKSPSLLCEYVYQLANEFNTFYHACPVLGEPNADRQRSHVRLIGRTYDTLVQVLDLLGIPVPERM